MLMLSAKLIPTHKPEIGYRNFSENLLLPCSSVCALKKKMEVTFETVVPVYQTTRHHIPENL
jgi:hypothetical protein